MPSRFPATGGKPLGGTVDEAKNECSKSHSSPRIFGSRVNISCDKIHAPHYHRIDRARVLCCVYFWIIYLKIARESRRRERKNARVGATKKAALFTHFLLQKFTPLGRSSVGSLPGIEMALLLIRTRVIIFWLRCLSGGNCVPRAEFFYALRQSLNFIAARRAKPRA